MEFKFREQRDDAYTYKIFERIVRVIVVLTMQKIPVKIQRWCRDSSGGDDMRLISHEYV